MKTHAQTASLLNEVSYEGFTFELMWRQALEVTGVGSRTGPIDARLRVVSPKGTCNVTGKAHPWKGRWWRLSPHMTDSEVVWTAFKAVMTCLEHEARERFLFKGVAIADSHVDVHKLADFMSMPSVKDGRVG